MRKLLLPIIAIVIMVAFGACSNEELMEDVKPDANPQEGRTLLLTASMPEDDPTSRVGLEQNADKSIALTWEAGDELQLAFVQGTTKVKVVTTLKAEDITAEGKRANFSILLPFQIKTGLFNLYGVYGGGGIDVSGDNPVAIFPTNPSDATSLAGEEATSIKNRKDVMLSFTSTDIEVEKPRISIVFKHIGSLFSVTFKNNGDTNLEGIEGMELTGVNNTGNENWAYNTAEGGQTYDLVTGDFLNKESAGNSIFFKSAQNTLLAGETITLWGWYPPLPVVKWPELQMHLKDATSTPMATSTNTLPARTAATAAGKSYYFYTSWVDELEFTDESFSDVYTVHVPVMGTLKDLLTPTQKAKIRKLTVTGQINKADYEVMKKDMPSLTHVNLSQVASYEGTTVNKIPTDAFGGAGANTTITSIILPNSLTAIGTSAFEICTGLTGPLTIPDGVTSIGNYAFKGCTNLTGPLKLSNKLITIGKEAFRDCTGLTGSLTIGDNVTSIGNYAFFNCKGFTGPLAIPTGMTTIEEYTFGNCSGFTGSLIIPNSVKTIGNSAFSVCKGLNGSLTISNNLTSIGSSAFSSCSGLTGVLTIPNSVTSIGNNAFSNCEGFTGSLIIPDNVTSIGSSAFSDCKGFTGSLIIPDNVTSIGSSAFSQCTGLNGTLSISTGISSIERYTFFNCFHLTGRLDIPNSVTSIGDYAFYGCRGIDVFQFLRTTPITYTDTMLQNEKLVQVPMGTEADYKTKWGANASRHKIEGVVHVPTMGSLNSVLSDAQKASATKMKVTGQINKADFDVMKNQMPNLTYIDLSEVTCEGNKIPNNAIGDNNPYKTNEKIKTVILPESITEIGEYAFRYCEGLSGTLTIPNSVKTIGYYAFANCPGLTGSLTIPNSVTTIIDKAFYRCTGLTGTLTIPNSLTKIGGGAFQNTGFTGTLTIPNSVKVIGFAAFRDCRGFTGTLTIPNSVTEIGPEAFYDCTGFTGSVTIPNSVTIIDRYAFNGCTNIPGFKFISPIPVTYNPAMLHDGKPVKVPTGTANSYKTKWGTNASRHTITEF